MGKTSEPWRQEVEMTQVWSRYWYSIGERIDRSALNTNYSLTYVLCQKLEELGVELYDAYTGHFIRELHGGTSSHRY